MYIGIYLTGETVVVVRRDPDQQPIRRGVVAEGVFERGVPRTKPPHYTNNRNTFVNLLTLIGQIPMYIERE